MGRTPMAHPDGTPQHSVKQVTPALENARRGESLSIHFYLKEKKKISTSSVPLTSSQEDPRLGALNRGAYALAVIFLSQFALLQPSSSAGWVHTVVVLPAGASVMAVLQRLRLLSRPGPRSLGACHDEHSSTPADSTHLTRGWDTLDTLRHARHSDTRHNRLRHVPRV